MKVYPLVPGYTLRQVDKATYQKVFQVQHLQVFTSSVLYNYREHFDEETKANYTRLEKPFLELPWYHFLIEYEGEPVGWHLSRQTDPETFQMSYSGILPAHRKKGIYSEVLRLMLELAKEEGYLRVCSKHHPTNNAVLIPKLKAGFCISGFELSEKYGMLVDLTYLFDEERRSVLSFRAGHERLVPEVAEKISLLKS